MAQGCGQRSLHRIAGTIGILAALAACGGGGGGGTPPGGGGTPTPIGTPTTTPPITNASGVVVDDANGSPLSGVSVKLMPWAPCAATPAPASITPESDGCPTPLPSPQATTNAQGQFTLNGAPDGHYILVIGSDTVSTPPPGYTPSTCNPCSATPTPAPLTIQATVHDNVMLTGGTQALAAPSIPPIPTITPKPWETNGDYRLAKLDPTLETPCYIAWQYQRGTRGLPLGTIDEWLIEQVRSLNLANQTASANGVKYLTTGFAYDSGGTTCDASLVNTFAFTNDIPFATDLRTLWFGGQYAIYSAFGGTNNEADGLAEFPIDPRSFVDPNISTWL